MATDWAILNKASSTDNWSVSAITKTSQGPAWESLAIDWEDMTAVTSYGSGYWDWSAWTIIGTATTRDSD